jgi:hypothetical protein
LAANVCGFIYFFTIIYLFLHGADLVLTVISVVGQLAFGGSSLMNRNLKAKILVLAFVSVCLLGATASAGCADSNKLGALLRRQSGEGANSSQPGSLLRIADDESDPIVGMWHVTFTAQGNEMGPPDGTPIDNALVTWHSDGTEIMNSVRPPQDGQWCMGIWKKQGKNTYKLNHFAWFGNDTTNAPSGIGNPTGPTRFFEEVTLSPDKKHYTGHFTLDAYDTNGTQVAHIIGDINGTRITMDTTVPDLL